MADAKGYVTEEEIYKVIQSCPYRATIDNTWCCTKRRNNPCEEVMDKCEALADLCFINGVAEGKQN